MVIAANAHPAINHHMGADHTANANTHLRAYHGKGANTHPLSQTGGRINQRGGMNFVSQG
jgi:hypothetical protein